MGWMEEFEKAVNEQKNAAKKKRTTRLVPGIAPGGTSSGWMEEYRKAVEAVTTPPQQGSGYFQKGALSTGNVGRAILGTGADAGTDLLSGIVGMGEKALDALVQISPYMTNALDDRTVVSLQQQQAEEQAREYMKKGAAEFVSKDLYDEQAVARKILSGVYAGMELAGKTQAGMQLTAEDLDRARANQKRAEAYMEDDMELDSVLGQKSDALVGSLGQMMGTGALQALGVPTWLTMGLTSYGGEAENALKSGASYEEATGSALISAGAEVLSEKLFGGSGLGEKGLIDLDHLTRGISNKLVKTLADYGVDMAAEGFEEVFSEVAGNLGSALYREEKLGEILASEEAFEGYLDAFISGSAISGILNAPKAAGHAKEGTDYRADFTQNEQKVVDKVYHDRLVELEKKGDVSAREKSRLYKDVSRDMEKGYISTDTIEEVLGGEAQTAYDSLRKEAQEYQTLYDTESGRLSERQKDRLAELKKKNEANPYETALKTAGDQLSGDVFGLVKGERLAESYNEKTRRGQNFEADLSRYDKKYHQTIQNAIDSGTLNNTNRSHELVDFIAKISADKGISFDFTNNEKLRQTQFAVEGKTVNGYKTDTGITLNVQSPKYLETTVGHEIAHVLEGTELYDTLSEAAKNYAISKEGLDGYNARVKAAEELYRGVKGANPDGEVVADLVGEYIFSDTDFVSRLSTGNRDLFDRIFDEIKYLCRVVTAGSKEARQLEKVKKAFEKAYRAEIKNPTGDGGVKYALAKIEDVTPSREQREQNIQEVSQMEPVYAVDKGKLIPGEKSIKDIYREFFTQWGENIHSDVFGDIAVKNSSIRSEMRHGSTPVKVASIEAIPSVIHNGKIVEWIEKDSGLMRIVVAAPIKIGETPYFMGVMLQRDTQNQRLYLHDVVIEKEASNPSQEHLDSTGPAEGSGNLYTSNILDKIVKVKSQLSLSDTNSMPNSGSQYSLSEQSAQANTSPYDYTKSFAQQLTDFQNGSIRPDDALVIGPTPDVLKKIGLASIPMTINQKHVGDALNGTYKGTQQEKLDHTFTAQELSTLPEKIADPIAIIYDKRTGKANASESNIDVLVEMAVASGKEVIAAVQINGNGRINGIRIDTNKVATVHGNSDSITRLTDAINEEQKGTVAVFYVNKAKTTKVLQRTGNPIPGGLSNLDGFIHSITDPGSPVKMRISSATESQQFKRWFGDWQNHPENASKVVNADGTPKAVYHGTNKSFNVFQSQSGEYWFSEYEDYAESMMEERGGGEVKSVYLNMRNPYRAKLSPGQFSDPTYEAPIIRQAKAAGHDGVIIENDTTDPLAEDTFYVVFRPEQIKSATDNIGTFDGSNPDIRYSLSDTNSMPRGRGTLGRDIMYAPAAGESSAVPNADNAAPNAENVLANAENALPDAAAAKNASAESPYEGIPIRSDIPQRATEDIGPVRSDLTAPAEKASAPMRDIGPVRADIGQTAGQGSGGTRMKERSWVETATGSETVGGAIRKEDLDPDKLYYQPISNRKTLDNANALLDRQGYEAAVPYFNMKLADRNVSLDDVALGERLIQEALKRGDKETAAELIQNVAILGTELGQKVQALSIIKRLTPEGQLMMLQKTVERGKTKGDKAFEGAQISQEMKDKILGVYNSDGTFDQNALNAAVEEVKQQIADTMKVGAWEKVNAWRYLSMLGNPKTHIRNLVSNVAMKGAVAVKNAAARTIESVVRPENRTKTWKKATTEVRDFAAMKTEEMKDIITGGGKYSESADIKEKRAIFKNKVLNGMYEFNSEMLSKEDWWFGGPAFRSSLSEFLTANGIRTQADMDARPETVEKGIQYAVEQAQIATFQQYSKLASMISSMERSSPGAELAVGAVLPFKKTPINVAKTGLSYSPLGFAKTLTYDAAKVRRGEMEASTMIDRLAQNLTGSALTLAGYLLAKAGFLNGAGEDDKEGKYDYQLGEQAYSVNIGGANYSLAWLSPVAMPLFVGANAYELLVAGEEWNPDVVIEALGKTIDPLSEMSFLSSLNDMLSSYDSGVQKFFGIGESMVESYLGQFIPTLFSQVATVMDDTRRSTKVGSDSSFKSAERIRNQLMYKIPFLRQTLEPSTDIWGNDVKQTENVLTRAFESFLAPYSKRADITSNVDVELKRLYGATGDTGLLPSVPGNSFSYRGEKYKMSEEEYTVFKHTYGQSAGELMKKLFATDAYRNADADTRADMVNQVYDYAMDEARREYLAGKGLSYTNATVSGTGDKRYYKENSIKAAVERNLTLDEFDFSVKYPEKYKIAKAVGGYEDYIAYKEDMKDMDLGEKADYISALKLTTQQKNILINGETDRKEPIDLTGYENYSSFEEFEYARDNPENYTFAKAVGGYESYKQYSSDLNEIKSDKDEYGQSISGSRKKKVLDYINNLDADYGTKLLLFKSEYTSYDDENDRIVAYLNSREEFSTEEKRTILLRLGFKVDKAGNISW